MVERARNRPPQPVRHPNRNRHTLDGIGRHTRIKGGATIALPWVDMEEDTRLINEGWAQKLPNNRFRVNGRTYFMEGTSHGTLVPEEGIGIVRLNGEELLALRIIAEHGSHEAAVFRLFREGIEQRHIDTALILWNQRSRSKKP